MAVRHYRVTLTTLGPVHIGTGERYLKHDYLRVGRDEIGVLDPYLFVEGLEPGEADEYCRFLMEDSGRSFQDFLDAHPPIKRTALESLAYTVRTPLARSGGRDRNLDVHLCVKDPEFRPYIPGSSLKGMLRTALLTHIIAADRDRYSQLFDRALARGGDLTGACKRIEGEAFWQERPHAETTNDIMRFVSVSDSEPLTTDDLVFAQKFDRFSLKEYDPSKSDGGDDEGNRLTLYREAIRPDAKAVLRLDIDERIDAYLPGLTLDADGITSVLGSFNKLYEESFLSHFSMRGVEGYSGASADGGSADGICSYRYPEGSGFLSGIRCKGRAVPGSPYCEKHMGIAKETKSVCHIGGGVGFGSKTVLAALFEGQTERVEETSRILYGQFTTELDHTDSRTDETWANAERAGFPPEHKEFYGNQKQSDHRHWRDVEFGVSPHTVKLALVGDKKYLMGRCSIEVKEV